jgi:hypothetical protein
MNSAKEWFAEVTNTRGLRGTIHDAIRVIMLTMERASGATASVSALYTLIQTPAKASLSAVIEQDSAT